MRIPYNAPRSLAREFIALSPEISAAIQLTMIGGWRRAIEFQDANANANEVLLTERLRDGMRAELNSQGRKIFIVLQGSESRSSNTVIIPDGRTDIPLLVIGVFLQYGEHDPHAIIECKRISGSDTHLCREYVVEGIDRFRSGKYAENHSLGFMVGYLLTGSAADSATGINGYLSRKSREPEHLRSSEKLADTDSWISLHARSGQSAHIMLKHVFLDFGL